ncbi:MAG: hypothetical protein O4M80_06010, partial [Buchnera aphidicola]|nr:hypothetical protein [Buchnera aphidicola]
INTILIKNCFSSWLLSNVCLYTKIKFYLGLIKNILCKNLQILILVPHLRYIYRIKKILDTYFNVSIQVI